MERDLEQREFETKDIYDVEICVNGYVSHEEQLDTKTVKLNYLYIHSNGNRIE